MWLILPLCPLWLIYLWIGADQHQARFLIQSKHQVHVLYSLAGGAFHEIVLGAQQHDAAGARVVAEGEIHEVRAGDVFCVGQFLFPEQADEIDTAWQQTLENLELSHRKLKETISRLNDEQLSQIIVHGKNSKYFLLHGLIQHRIYHAGQIALLKKALSQ